MAIILHRNGLRVFVNLSAIDIIKERGDASAVIYFIGDADSFGVDESFDDIMKLIENEKHG